jgi:hypothetical protein
VNERNWFTIEEFLQIFVSQQFPDNNFENFVIKIQLKSFLNLKNMFFGEISVYRPSVGNSLGGIHFYVFLKSFGGSAKKLHENIYSTIFKKISGAGALMWKKSLKNEIFSGFSNSF